MVLVSLDRRSGLLPCFHVPYSLNKRYFERSSELAEIAKILDPELDSPSFRSLAIHGIGGVGKTQTALQYVYSVRGKYDSIFWISADNVHKMSQEFIAISRRLGLSIENEIEEPSSAMAKVKRWLSDTDCRWLVVYDNADKLGVLHHGWPQGCSGSVLVTTRDFMAGFNPASHGLHIKPFDDDKGSLAILSLLGRNNHNSTDMNSAVKITRELGGLPLALSQMSGIIIEQKLTLESFLPLYKRRSDILTTHKASDDGYEYTLDTVWELAFRKLPKKSAALQKLLTFFYPDCIQEAVLVGGMEKLVEKFEDHELAFIADEMAFMNAKQGLLVTALIDRAPKSASLSVHRLVQAAVYRHFSEEDRPVYFSYAVKILLEVFPATWKGDLSEYLFTQWEACESCIRHVYILRDRLREYKFVPQEKSRFIELLNRASRYLFEAEKYADAKQLLELVLKLEDDKESLEYSKTAETYSLLLIDLHKPSQALIYALRALEIRKTHFGTIHPRVASVYNILGTIYTALYPDLETLKKGMEYHRMALDIRLKHDHAKIGNTYSNMCSHLLRMGDHDGAENMLAKCPALVNFSDETFLKQTNPRFTSDMLLLSRIRAAQGHSEEALRLALRVLDFRRRKYGNGYKVCVGLTHAAELYEKAGKPQISLQLLNECIGIAENLEGGNGHTALACFRASMIIQRMDEQKRTGESRDTYLEKALRLKRALLQDPENTHLRDFGDSDPASFTQLVPFILW